MKILTCLLYKRHPNSAVKSIKLLFFFQKIRSYDETSVMQGGRLREFFENFMAMGNDYRINHQRMYYGFVYNFSVTCLHLHFF